MSDVKPNQTVKIFLKTRQGVDVILECLVKEYLNDRLSLNFNETSFEPYYDYLQEGDEIGVKIFTPLGVIVFYSMILNSPQEEEFVIEYVEASPQIQRREYARIECHEKIIIETSDKNLIIARTLDISGSGIKFEVNDDENQHIVPEDIVKMTLTMPNAKSVVARAKIVNTTFLPRDEHVLTFIEIDEKDRDRIIKRCFELQTNTEESFE